MAFRLLVVLLLFLAGDLYFFRAVATVTTDPLFHTAYWLVDILLLAGGLSLAFLQRMSPKMERWIPVLMSALLLVFVPKILTMPLLLAEDISRLFRGFPTRSLFVSEAVLVLGGVFFLVVLFGITRGRHFYKVRRQTLHFPDLPEAFDGFTLTQLSDVHSGSFTDARGVQKGLDMVNAQKSDVILFTGDLVNNQASEMDRWIPAFAGLSAPMGKYSVLGNHDYGDYVRWPSAEAKRANLARLKQVHAEIGFRLLLNEAIPLEKNGDRILLVGVENWGTNGFHQYGDLQKAVSGIPEPSFKILMSHDPSHWEHVVLDSPAPVHLTLSGHTHGMQFGLELFGIKWSPIQYVYRHWAGLYKKAGKYLYVNRGFGFLGLRGRIGIWPEITVITLKKAR